MIEHHMRFFIALACMTAALTVTPIAINHRTVPAMVTGSNIQNTPLETLKNENKQLETDRKTLQNSEDGWNRAYVWLAVATVLLGLFSWFSQRQAATLSLKVRSISDKIAANASTIHDLEMEAEAAARLRMEKRTLSQEQFITISETLRSFPRRTAQVICPSGNQEAYGFAKQISRVLESAHWITGAGTVQQDNAPQNTGITLFVRDADSEGAVHLRDALAKAGIWSSINARNALPGIIRVYVGAKP